MLCPVCRTDLHMTERQGVEIDYCPKCRGVWLDRGELDKIIERASAVPAQPQVPVPGAAPVGPPPPPPSAYGRPPQAGGYVPDPDSDYDNRGRYPQGGYPHKKRKGFLGELFDFD